jgi:ubiquitin carboxyl-terminal hydrolase 9/24
MKADECKSDDATPIREGPSHITVEDAGNPVVNGIYVQCGVFENAFRYVRNGVLWNYSRHQFNILLCNVSNNTKYWYISIVPNGGNPGTSSDIDFYTTLVTASSRAIPP